MSETKNPLSAAERTALATKIDAPGVRRLALHLGVLLLTGTTIMIARSPLVVGLALLAHAVVMTFLFAPLHESVHRTAFASRRLNRLAGWLGGAVLILPPRYFAHFHLAHHRYTQDPEHDPELLTAKPVDWLGYLWLLSGLEYWYRSIAGLLRRAAGKADAVFIPERGQARVVTEARIFLAGYAAAIGLSAALQIDWLLWLWVYPALLGQPFLRAYLLAEHWGCPYVREIWRNTRSTVSNPAVRWLAWNMPYHAEHHAHAYVPFHALPALSQRLAAAQVISPGYANFHRDEAPGLIQRGGGG